MKKLKLSIFIFLKIWIKMKRIKQLLLLKIQSIPSKSILNGTKLIKELNLLMIYGKQKMNKIIVQKLKAMIKKPLLAIQKMMVWTREMRVLLIQETKIIKIMLLKMKTMIHGKMIIHMRKMILMMMRMIIMMITLMTEMMEMMIRLTLMMEMMVRLNLMTKMRMILLKNSLGYTILNQSVQLKKSSLKWQESMR